MYQLFVRPAADYLPTTSGFSLKACPCSTIYLFHLDRSFLITAFAQFLFTRWRSKQSSCYSGIRRNPLLRAEPHPTISVWRIHLRNVRVGWRATRIGKK